MLVDKGYRKKIGNGGFLLVTLLVFFFVYNFRLPIVKNSSYLAMMVLLCLLLVNGSLQRRVLYFIRTRIFAICVLSYVVFFLATFSTLIINVSYDISIVKTIINNLASMVFCVIISALIISDSSKNVFHYLVFILLLQSFAVIVMMFSPDANQAIQQIIRTEQETTFMSQTYGGVRGFGIAGSVAFGLAVTMGLLGYILIVWYTSGKCELGSIAKFCLFFVALFASISAGRASLLGYLVGLFYAFLVLAFKSKINSIAKYSLLSAFAVAGMIQVVSMSGYGELLLSYSEYAFQFLYNYLESGEVSTTSTSHLSEMYFSLNGHQLLIGDGKYSNPDGSYYLETDAGFMRFVLFFGLPFSLVIYSIFIMISCEAGGYLAKSYKNGILMMLFLAIIAFVYHIKGEVILFGVGFMKVFYIFLFYHVMSVKRKTGVEF